MHVEGDLSGLAARVTAARTRLGWSKERAAREAGVSSITLKRVEDGLAVQDTKLAAILQALQLNDEPRVPGLRGGAVTSERMRAAVDNEAARMFAEAEIAAARLMEEGDPEGAAQVLSEAAQIASELRSLAERALTRVFGGTRPDFIFRDPDGTEVVIELKQAARTTGKASAGQKRRAEADQAGEPPADDPDDMEPR